MTLKTAQLLIIRGLFRKGRVRGPRSLGLPIAIHALAMLRLQAMGLVDERERLTFSGLAVAAALRPQRVVATGQARHDARPPLPQQKLSLAA